MGLVAEGSSRSRVGDQGRSIKGKGFLGALSDWVLRGRKKGKEKPNS